MKVSTDLGVITAGEEFLMRISTALFIYSRRQSELGLADCSNVSVRVARQIHDELKRSGFFDKI